MTKLMLRDALKAGLRVFGYQLIFAFVGFILIPGLLGAPDALRVPVLVLLLALAAMLMFTEGAYRGQGDWGNSQTLAKLTARDGYVPTAREEAKRYHWLKGLIAAAIGALPTFLIALAVAVQVRPFAYSVQDLPTWLSPYMDRPEIGGLAYLRDAVGSATVFDYLRIAMRALLFPYVGLLGSASDEASYLFDRLSPLLALAMPLMTCVGYLLGPSRYAREAKAIETAKNTPRKRLKKNRGQGQGKAPAGPREKKQLI